MLLFKTSGDTIESVIMNQKHAFDSQPKDWSKGEIILISKNKKDLSIDENQIQYVTHLKDFRLAEDGEVDKYWPGNHGRWRYIAEFYGIITLEKPFNLKDIIGNEGTKNYGAVVTQSQLSKDDADKVISYLETQGVIV